MNFWDGSKIEFFNYWLFQCARSVNQGTTFQVSAKFSTTAQVCASKNFDHFLPSSQGEASFSSEILASRKQSLTRWSIIELLPFSKDLSILWTSFPSKYLPIQSLREKLVTLRPKQKYYYYWYTEYSGDQAHKRTNFE